MSGTDEDGPKFTLSRFAAGFHLPRSDREFDAPIFGTSATTPGLPKDSAQI
jgi:hypothetical protein